MSSGEILKRISVRAFVLLVFLLSAGQVFPAAFTEEEKITLLSMKR
jgi:hypothetical protein